MAVTRYAIANYLSDEQRRRAVAATYLIDGFGAPPLRTAEGCCPLGVALGGPVTAHCPTSAQVATLLGFWDEPDYRRISATARRFMQDWDAGRIPLDQLPVALGVEL